MGDKLPRYILAICLLLLLPAAVDGCEVQPLDTTLVFKKQPATAQPVKIEKRGDAGKKTVAKKRKKKSEKKTTAAPRVKKSKSDSLCYEPVKYSLGDRVIMRGDTGADVKKLAEIMVKNLYLDEKDIPYTKSGLVLYDGELLRAFKLFQKVSGLYEDGIVGEAAIKELRKIHRWRRTSK